MKGILGKKVGMTQVFDESGEVIPVTVIEAGPCFVTQKKTVEQDLYAAIQDYWGYGSPPETDFNIPDLVDTWFLRGADANGLHDPDRSDRTPLGSGGPEDVGSTQHDSAKAHTHDLSNHRHDAGSLPGNCGKDQKENHDTARVYDLLQSSTQLRSEGFLQELC